MTLNSISILNFKNIVEANLEFSQKVNCFTGNNGMGKTNLLDAIYYLSFCKSCTNQGDALVINDQSDMMLLQGHYTRRDEPMNISLGLQRGKRKVLKHDGKEYQKLSQHIGLLPIVMISPMDWELIRGSGEERRRLMDQVISQSDSEYLAALISYSKSLTSRNALIRQGYRDQILFDTFESQMCRTAAIIHEARAKWIDDFSPIFLDYYHSISGGSESVTITYNSHLNSSDMQSILSANRERDLLLGFTSGGVHRDDIELQLNGHSMRKIGSQGQCKTYTIALRLAQFDFLKRQSGITPILLLDDIFDKLDASRVSNIIAVSADARFGQIFITDTNRTNLDNIIRNIGGDYKIFSVNKGICQESAEGGEE
jgi:DNA replication and repair protein RecF